jgi:hypothetical protein
LFFSRKKVKKSEKSEKKYFFSRIFTFFHAVSQKKKVETIPPRSIINKINIKIVGAGAGCG